jgi:phosphate uptake regulator
MERKLIRQGGGGYTVYLPKAWVERKGLKAGTNVTVEETEAALVISAPRKLRRDTVLAITDENRGDVQNLLTHLYRRGADSILLTEADPRTVQHATKTAADLLLGFEITEKEGKKMRLENLSEPAEARYEMLLRRVFHIIAETHRVVREQLHSGKRDMAPLEESRRQLDKYVLFCRRTLVKELDRRSVSTAWELLTFLMHIEHAYYYLAQHAAEHSSRATAHSLEFYDEIGVWFTLFTRAHVEQDIAAVHTINRHKAELYRRVNERLVRSRGHETVLLCDIRELLRLVQVGTSPIMSEILESRLAGSEK